jgi:outer membrane protein assembly factor BamB
VGTGVLASACPVYMGGNLYVANQDGLVFAARAGIDHARKMWPYPEQPQASGAFASDFVVEDRGAFIGCQDYSVYAFEPGGGKPLWRFRCGAAVSQPVQVGQTNVYALAAGDAFYAIDLATGRQPAKWRLSEGRMVLAELGNEALVLNKRNELMAVDAAIGQVRTVTAMSGLDLFVPNTKTPAIYAGSAEGLLCCIRPKGAGHVVPAMLGKQGK